MQAVRIKLTPDLGLKKILKTVAGSHYIVHSWNNDIAAVTICDEEYALTQAQRLRYLCNLLDSARTNVTSNTNDKDDNNFNISSTGLSGETGQQET